MKRIAVLMTVLAAVGGAVAAPIVGNLTQPADPVRATPKPAELVEPAKSDTPMGERIATLGILNKRNGLSRDVSMKPGQAVRIGDLVVRLKACETSADWEADQLTGAFVQVIVHGADDHWRKVFSGWLYKESPSLNAVEHPIYDVWAKACKMRHAEIGPDTVTVDAGSDASGGKRSNAPKSPDAAAAGPDPITPETAASSNAI